MYLLIPDYFFYIFVQLLIKCEKGNEAQLGINSEHAQYWISNYRKQVRGFTMLHLLCDSIFISLTIDEHLLRTLISS
jgi:hypothetical protein